MGIARSLRKAGYLRPVSGAIGNYLDAVNREQKQKEEQELFNKLVQGAQEQIQFGTPSPLAASEFDLPQPQRSAQAIFDYQTGVGGLKTIPQQQKASTGSALSQLSKAFEPPTVSAEPFKVGDTVFGRDPNTGKVDFTKPIYQPPQEEKLYELSEGETLTDKSGRIIARGTKKTPEQKRLVTGGRWGDDGNWINAYSDGTEVKTRFQKPATQIETDLYEARKTLNILENETPDQDGYYPNGDTQAEHDARINSTRNNIQFLKKETGKAKKYFNEQELSDLEALKKTGADVETIIKQAKLNEEEAKALREIYRGLGE